MTTQSASTKPYSDQGAREALQRAWDSVESLPPIDFTEEEAMAILKALSADDQREG